MIDAPVLFLTGYGLLQLFYFIRLTPWILEAGFTMGLWGFSFALGAMANTGAHLIVAGRLVELGWGMFIFGSVLIILLWCGTLWRIATTFKTQPAAVEK